MNDPTEVKIQFVFPGEGAIVFGQFVTPDDPVLGIEALDNVTGWGRDND